MCVSACKPHACMSYLKQYNVLFQFNLIQSNNKKKHRKWYSNILLIRIFLYLFNVIYINIYIYKINKTKEERDREREREWENEILKIYFFIYQSFIIITITANSDK